MQFQSTRPIRGATAGRGVVEGPQPISIHAPHTGRDLTAASGSSRPRNFNPRAPYGARHRSRGHTGQRADISIHAPHTGRDGQGSRPDRQAHAISIHAPHTGRDWSARSGAAHGRNFNPRAPYGARPVRPVLVYLCVYFNPRAPYGARRFFMGLPPLQARISIHAPHTGRDPAYVIR